ncbi:MAG: hypothetical protein KKE73_11665 [Proteobacteria bacterium]|nr:hypothetical protein [Pseudomonadota bacterium]
MKSLPVLFLLILFLSLAAPARAGELVLDNFSETQVCCVEFDLWTMGSAETRTLCAQPQRRERFMDGLSAIGKLKVYCRDKALPEDSPVPSGTRYQPEGIYSPLCGYRVEISASGVVTFSEIN